MPRFELLPAGAFSHKDSPQARSGGAFWPRPRYESGSAAEVKTHLWHVVDGTPYAIHRCYTGTRWHSRKQQRGRGYPNLLLGVDSFLLTIVFLDGRAEG